MRILHVINQVSGRAGAEVSLREILRSRANEGHKDAVAVLNPTNNVLEPFEQLGIACYVPPVRLGRIRQLRHVRTAIDDFAPDLVHTSLFDADLVGRLAAFTAGIPTLTSVVNTSYLPEVAEAESTHHRKLVLVHRIDRFMARHLTSNFHAISQATADHAVEYLAVPRDRIRTVPRGRSQASLGELTPERRAAVRSRLGWGSHPVIVNVARQEPQKGHSVLLEAFARVRAERPDALLALVGRSGRSTTRIEQLLDELALGDSVHLLGVRTDVADILAGADIFVFPSLYEGLGGAAVEALGARLPIVASDIPALRELLGEDRGWLVTPGVAEELGSTILAILADPKEADRRAAAARCEFLARYELEACVRGMNALYDDMEARLAGSSPRPWRRPPRVTLTCTPDGS